MNSVTATLTKCLEDCIILYESSIQCSLQDRSSALRQAAIECHQKCKFLSESSKLPEYLLSNELASRLSFFVVPTILGAGFAIAAYEASRKKNIYSNALKKEQSPKHSEHTQSHIDYLKESESYWRKEKNWMWLSSATCFVFVGAKLFFQ